MPHRDDEGGDEEGKHVEYMFVLEYASRSIERKKRDINL